MRYPCGVGHMGPFVCAGTKGPEMDNYISLVVLVCLQEH